MAITASQRGQDFPVGKLWTTCDVANFLQIGSSKLAYLRAQGMLVLPVAKLGKALRFHPNEVRAWSCAGCPPADEWEAAKLRDPNLFDRQNF